MDKKKAGSKKGIDIQNAIPEQPNPQSPVPEIIKESQPYEEELEQMDVEDIRAHILDYYGINQEEEVERKEKKAQKFRTYISNSGLQTAFQLVVSEILAQSVAPEDFFKFASKRLKEIGREYHEIKECIDNGQQPQTILDQRTPQPPKTGKKDDAKPAPAKKGKK